MHQFLFYNEFIIHLYMFPAQLCSSSGGQNCITQHLSSSHSAGGRPMHGLGEDCSPAVTRASDGRLQSVMMTDAVRYNLDLLMMSTIVLETCRVVQ